jgi:hypothetical protein
MMDRRQPIYYHVQRGMGLRIFLIVLAVVLLIPGWTALSSGPVDLGLVAVVAIGPVLVALAAWIFTIMTIDVTSTEVRWWFGAGWPGGRIERSDLVAEEITNPGLFNGIGIHLTFTGWLWNVSLGSAVALHRNGKLATMLGTDDPNGLLAALATGAE